MHSYLFLCNFLYIVNLAIMQEYRVYEICMICERMTDKVLMFNKNYRML